jgi:Excalibur calcium-binding domain
MSLIGGIVAARRHLFTWFGGLALSAKAGIATAAFVTMSAGVVIGAPFTPTSAPWLKPTVAPYETGQTPSVLRPSMVQAATPTSSASSVSGSRSTAKPTGTSAPSTVQPTSAPATAAVEPTSTRTATTAPQTTSSVYYKSCAAASKAGAAPITIGQPGYRTGLDPNGNGVACEPQ